jgi:hypothetical protein
MKWKIRPTGGSWIMPLGGDWRLNMTAGKITNTFRVGRFTCKLTFADGQLSAEWRPGLPKRLSGKEWKAYRAGRDALIAEVAKAIGGGVLLVDV